MGGGRQEAERQVILEKEKLQEGGRETEMVTQEGHRSW
jgi:hypothetical protein